MKIPKILVWYATTPPKVGAYIHVRAREIEQKKKKQKEKEAGENPPLCLVVVMADVVLRYCAKENPLICQHFSVASL